MLSRLFLSIVLEDFSHCNSCIETTLHFGNGLVLKIVELKRKIRLKIRGMRFPVHFLIAFDILGYFFFQTERGAFFRSEEVKYSRDDSESNRLNIHQSETYF